MSVLTSSFNASDLSLRSTALAARLVCLADNSSRMVRDDSGLDEAY